MPASVTLRRDYSAEELRRLAKSAQTISQGRRLLSLAAVMDGMSRADAARIGGIGKRCATGFTGLMKPAPTGFWTIGRRAAAASVGGAASRTRGDRRSWPRQRGRRRCALAALRSQARHQGALRRRLSRTPCRNAVEAARLLPHQRAPAPSGAERRDRRGL